VIAGFLFRNSVSSIRKEMAKARTELQEIEQEELAHIEQAQELNANQNEKNVLAGMDTREYQEMYARIRAELLEELKQEYDQEKTK
jgi:hypothetical protein